MENFRVERAQRLGKVPPYLFAELDKAKAKAIEDGVDIINLGVGDPDLRTPENIIDTLCETARDTKNHRFGWSFKDANSKSCNRIRVLLLIAAIAMIAVTLIGQSGERYGLQRRYQANTIKKRRVLSLFFLGMWVIQHDDHTLFKKKDLLKSFREIKNKFGDIDGCSV